MREFTPGLRTACPGWLRYWDPKTSRFPKLTQTHFPRHQHLIKRPLRCVQGRWIQEETAASKEALPQSMGRNTGHPDFTGPGTARFTPCQDRRRSAGRSRNSRPVQEPEQEGPGRSRGQSGNQIRSRSRNPEREQEPKTGAGVVVVPWAGYGRDDRGLCF